MWQSRFETDETVRIEMVPIDLLRPHPKNARKRTERNEGEIATSIKVYGFTAPIMIDENNVILAGHGRVAAARRLGMTELPCRRITHLSKAKKTAYVIADNKLAEKATWDHEILAVNFAELESLEFELTDTGFDLGEIDQIMTAREEESPVSRKDAADDLPNLDETQVVSRQGDIWLLGRHRLVCGDALNNDIIDQLMGGGQADMAFLDPPYNVPIKGHVSGLGNVKHPEFAMASGEMSAPEFRAFLTKSLSNTAKHCRNGAIVDVCMDWRHIALLIAVGDEVFSDLKNLCVWNKTNGGMGTFYRSKHELIAIFKVGTAPHTNTFGLGDKGRYRTNVWTYPGVNSFSKDRMDQLTRHPTSKPVALVADAIRDVSHRGEVVLDLFGGSGTTLIAAETTGRIARLLEISPAYCDAIIRRWQNYSGKEAVLQQSGDNFEKTRNKRTREL